jgi:glutathione S-transferase
MESSYIVKTLYKLYQFPLCPFSRKVRVFLAEKKIRADLTVENFWERRKSFLSINPAGQVPALVIYETGQALVGSNVICEFLEETNTAHRLMGNSPENRAEVRRICDWFDHKFFSEVGKHVLYEKIIKYYKNEGTASPEALRVAKSNIIYHLDYLEFLLRDTTWLVGNKMTLADLCAASHLSTLDYLGDVPWEKHQSVKEWYALIKSRPSFAPILDDYISGFTPARHYSDLDF